MPFIEITMLEGSPRERKQVLLEQVARATHEALGVSYSGIRVWIKEIRRDEFLSGTTLEGTTPE
jgi:4-oxalocrotonate tautomerase family enzyme